MRKHKIVSIFVGLSLLIATLVVCLTGCSKNKYFSIVSSYTFWANKGEEAIAQTHVYDMVKEHMESETENGKKKKVLVLGFDGTRADALVNIRNSGVKDKNGNDIYSGDNPNNHISAVNHIVDSLGGKMYIAYAGGNVKENFQAPSTAPGWASITTGVWGVQNGVLNNPDGDKNIKNLDYKTFMLEYAMKGKNSIFMASWDAHKETYKNEMQYVKDNKIPMEFYGFGEFGTKPVLDKDGNVVLDENGEQVTERLNDNDIHKKLLQSVSSGESEKDVIFCIYDWADHNGHGTGFSNDNKNYVNAVRTNDILMYEVIKAVENRDDYENEDWLIILTADHGGIKTWHGEQNAECRTTFIVTNKPELVKTEYYSKNYNGLTEKL